MGLWSSQRQNLLSNIINRYFIVRQLSFLSIGQTISMFSMPIFNFLLCFEHVFDIIYLRCYHKRQAVSLFQRVLALFTQKSLWGNPSEEVRAHAHDRRIHSCYQPVPDVFQSWLSFRYERQQDTKMTAPSLEN